MSSNVMAPTMLREGAGLDAFRGRGGKLLAAMTMGAGVIAASGSPVPAPMGFAPAAVGPKAAVSAQVPMTFEANVGQADPQVRFVGHGAGYSLFLTPTEAVTVLRGRTAPSNGEPHSAAVPADAVMRMGLIGANPSPAVTGGTALPGIHNYFIGNDPARWHAGVPTYGSVRYSQVYPNVDLVYHTQDDGAAEYDFELAPGADPNGIAMSFDGAGTLSVAVNGDLILHPGAGEVRQHRPVIYQEIEGARREVGGGFELRGNNVASFRVGSYDHTRPLVIDPTLGYSTYLGGSLAEFGGGIAADGAGKAYVTGLTESTDFPMKNPFQAHINPAGRPDAFVAVIDTKASSVAASLLYATYLGGTASDNGRSIAIDPAGKVYVTGDASSSDFPTKNAFQTGAGRGWVAKLDPAAAGAASLVYSTYFPVAGVGIAADAAGNAYVTGTVGSAATIPTTANAVQTTHTTDDAYVAKFRPTGAGPLLYSTYLGGGNADSGAGVAMGAGAQVYVTGTTSSTDFPAKNAFQATSDGGDDAFATTLDTAAATPATALVYSTYLGGAGNDSGRAVAGDSAGHAYVTGSTGSSNFPTLAAFQGALGSNGSNAFVTELDTTKSGSASGVYSSYLGGNVAGTSDVGNGIAVDLTGAAVVGGATTSPDFPAVNAMLPYDHLSVDQPDGLFPEMGFVTRVSPGGGAGLIYSTYLGGGGYQATETVSAVAVDPSSPSAFVTGDTGSAEFPTTPTALASGLNNPTETVANPREVFVARVDLGGDQVPLVGQLQPRSADSTGGSTVLITGSRFLGTTSVRFGTVPANFQVISDSQILAVAPVHTRGRLVDDIVQVTVSKPNQPASLSTIMSRFVYGEGSLIPGPTLDSLGGSFTPTAPVENPLPGGKVLYTDADCCVLVSQVFDPATGTWSIPPGTIPPGGAQFATVSMADGRVLLTGNNDTATDAWIFDSRASAGAGGWTKVASMPTARNQHVAALLSSGKVLVVGGRDPNTGALVAPTNIYDPALNTWTAAGDLPTPRTRTTATLIDPRIGNCGSNCGKVLVSGGDVVGTDGPALSTAVLFDPQANGGAGGWSQTGSMAFPREDQQAVQTLDGKVVVIGGDQTGAGSGAPLSTAEIYDPATGSWANAAGLLGLPRLGHAATLLPNGKVLIAGGIQGAIVDIDEIYDPSTRRFQTAGADVFTKGPGVPEAGQPAAAALISGSPSTCGTYCGQVLIAALRNPGGLGTEFYTPRDGRLTQAGVVGADSALYTKVDAQPFQYRNGILLAAPAVVSIPTLANPGVSVPLYVGTGGDHRLYSRSENDSWQDLVPAGSGCIDNPAATVTSTPGPLGGSTLTVACQGTDHALYYAQAPLGQTPLPVVTSGFHALNGALIAGPAVSSINGTLTFFAVGTDHLVYSRTAAPSSTYTSIGAGCIGHPAVASSGSDAYFACQGLDGQLYYAKNTGGTGWGPYRPVFSQLIDGPGIAVTPSGVTIFVEGLDQSLYHTVINLAATTASPFVADGGSIRYGTGATGLR